jgi:signal recognition particle GTPase
VSTGIAADVDTVIIDTAGRLHTKTGLMDELGKVKRVIEKQSPVDEVILVLDATTGQNGLTQAKVFSEVVDVTGIALTKLDGTAKGGIVVAVQRELGVPVKLVGLGETAEDLAVHNHRIEQRAAVFANHIIQNLDTAEFEVNHDCTSVHGVAEGAGVTLRFIAHRHFKPGWINILGQ